MTETQYLDVLIQSQKKKLLLLNKISVLNTKQRKLLEQEEMDPEEFEANVNEKDTLVAEIVQLDAGFDEVYARLKAVIETNRSLYSDQLQTMQDLIRQIMAKDVAIRAEESRNYTLAQKKFSKIKQQVRQVKTSSKMVGQYYRNMMGLQNGDSHFMDNKK
ncbi:MAG: flagellar protein FliT [bacterium]|nr:flagellar protein FliT [bacterium]